MNNQKMSRCLLALGATLLSASAYAQPAAAIRIFITSAAAEADAKSGFVDVGDDSKKAIADITKELRDQKELVVVADRTTAALILEYIDMKSAPTGKTSAAKKIWGPAAMGINDGASLVTVRTTLVAGEYRKPMEGTGHKGNGKDAIENLVKNVVAFAKANSAKLQGQPPSR